MSASYRPVGLAVVGAGNVAWSTYLPQMAAYAGKVRLEAVCDLNATDARRAAEQFGARRWTTDFDSLLSDPAIEAVVILTNIDTHFPLSMKALEAGRHVYVEKTATRTLAEFDRLLQTAEARSLILACAPTISLSPLCQEVQKIIRSGALGRVCFARVETSGGNMHRAPNATTDQRWFYGASAGPLRDRGIYSLHLFSTLFGPIQRVSAFQAVAIPERTFVSGPAAGMTVKTESPDNCHLMLDFGGALFATINSTFCLPRPQTPSMEIYGDDGYIKAELHQKDPALRLYSRASGDDESEIRPAPWLLSCGVEHMADAIRTGAPLGFSPQQARHVFEAMDAAFQSAAEGRAVNVESRF